MCEITIVKNLSEANAVTHSGRFHADEIMATVILMKYFGNLRVFRTFEAPKVSPDDDVIVYDIGCGKYDHHQKGGNGVRSNGVPYASAGLIWKRFGKKIVEKYANPYVVSKNIDRAIIQGIDAVDCGAMPLAEYPAQVMSISKAISGFNPTWKNNEDSDEAFLKAVRFAEVIFDNTVRAAEAKAEVYEFIEEAIEASDEHVMVLEYFAPWQEYLFTSDNPKAATIEFVVYPSNRGKGYNWQCVPDSLGTFGQRKKVPIEWLGIEHEELRRVTGVQTANFCHPAGFIGGAETLEDTIKMAKIASGI